MRELPTSAPAHPETAEPPTTPTRAHWAQKLSAFVFILFCLELGAFLLVYPWTSGWSQNLFATLLSTRLPHWTEYWDNSYVRGAVSGLGLLDLYVSFGEILRLRRFSGH